MKEVTCNNNSESQEYKSFVFYGSIRETIERLPKKHGDELLRVIMHYGTSGVIIPCTKSVEAVFMSIKPNIDAAEKRYRKRGETMAKKQQASKNEEPALSTRDSDIENAVDNYISTEHKPLGPDGVFSLAYSDKARKEY